MDFLNEYSSDEDEPLLLDTNSNLCMACKQEQKIYKCPRCSYLTCSLKCCRKHKIDTSCSGIRDRAEYVSIKDYSEKNLRNDYHFLEDVIQSKKRKKYLLNDHHGSMKSRKNTSKALKTDYTILNQKDMISAPLNQSTKKLLKACHRRNMTLITMSPGMTKRKLNTTYVQQNIDTIFWRLHFVFILTEQYSIPDLFHIDPLEDRSEHFTHKHHLIEYCLPKVKETEILHDILNNLFQVNSNNAIFRHMIRNIREIPLDQLCYLLFQIPGSTLHPTFYELSSEFTIKDILQGKNVIEFPIIYIGSQQNTKSLSRTVMTLSSTAPSDAGTDTCTPAVTSKRKSELPHDHDLKMVRQNKVQRNDNKKSEKDLDRVVYDGSGDDKDPHSDDEIDDMRESSIMRKKTMISSSSVVVDETGQHIDIDNSEEEEEEEEEEDNVAEDALILTDTEFLGVLQQVEMADIDTLKRMIEEVS